MPEVYLFFAREQFEPRRGGKEVLLVTSFVVCHDYLVFTCMPGMFVPVFQWQVSKTHMGGTMRLGARKTYFTTADCLTSKL